MPYRNCGEEGTVAWESYRTRGSKIISNRYWEEEVSFKCKVSWKQVEKICREEQKNYLIFLGSPCFMRTTTTYSGSTQFFAVRHLAISNHLTLFVLHIKSTDRPIFSVQSLQSIFRSWDSLQEEFLDHIGKCIIASKSVALQ